MRRRLFCRRPWPLRSRGVCLWRAVGLVVLLAGGAAMAPEAMAQPGTIQPGTSGRRVVSGDSLMRLARWRDTLRVDLPPPFRLRPFVVPGSLRLVANGAALDTSAYRLDLRTGELRLGLGAPDYLVQLVAEYETYGYRLAARYGLPGVVRREATPDTSNVLRGFDDPPEAVPEASTLRRTGAITRGVLAGTNRDVALESSLRVQLDGEIAPGVRVEAALTDANTPILADGTTQRLSEFDRVALSVFTRRTTARLGDVDLSFEGSDLARLNRKVQGALVETRLAPRGLFSGGRVAVAGAASRGLFRLQQIVPIEGVQGPYRLDGASGETFVLVLPGSEVVYLNGERLTRDRDADYTIEYATGEITLTSRRLLRATDRLTVEFQYSANQFSRTLTVARAEGGLFGPTTDPRLSVGLTVAREADAASLPAGLDLTEDDAAAIRASGDGIAFRDGATRLPLYDPVAPFVQYRREVRAAGVGAVGSDTVYVALETAPEPGEAVYRVRFTRRGPGQGRYVRAVTAISGIAYAYAGPGRGDYDPVRLLPKPRAQSLVGVQVRARPLGRHLEAFADVAATRLDENRLSPLDQADDAGRGAIVGVRLRESPLGRLWRWGLGRGSLEATHQARSAAFAPFDRSRPADFEQRWNVPAAIANPFDALDANRAETVTEARALWAPSARARFEVDGGRLALSDALSSLRGAVRSTVEAGPLALRYGAEMARSEGTLAVTVPDSLVQGPVRLGGAWTRGGGEARVRAGFWSPGVVVDHDHRTQRVGTDTLDAASRGFAEVRPGVRIARQGLTLGLDLVGRSEWLPRGGVLERAGQGGGVAATWAVQSRGTLRADGRATLRRTRYRDGFASSDGASDQDAVAIEQELRWAPLRRGLDLGLTYDAQTERRPQQQEVYVRVSPELAEARYVWRDANGNGARDLDEFVLETAPYEGEYARTFVSTDRLLGVATVRARARLGLDPQRFTDAPLLRPVSLRATLDVDEQSTAGDAWRLYVLDLRRFLVPGVTVSGRLRGAADVSLWRDHRRGGLDVGAVLARSQSSLAGGDERRRVRTFRVEGRLRPGGGLLGRMVATDERNEAESDRFATRRYRIDARGVDASLGWQPRPAVSLTAGAVVGRRADRVAGRRADLVRIPLDLRYAGQRRFVATATAEASFVRLRGGDGSGAGLAGEAAYELTDGRGRGRSLLWSAQLQGALTRTLGLTVAYDGRAPEGLPVLHTLRMQATATF